MEFSQYVTRKFLILFSTVVCRIGVSLNPSISALSPWRLLVSEISLRGSQVLFYYSCICFAPGSGAKQMQDFSRMQILSKKKFSFEKNWFFLDEAIYMVLYTLYIMIGLAFTSTIIELVRWGNLRPAAENGRHNVKLETFHPSGDWN